MKKMKIISLLLAIFMVASVFVACSGGDDGGDGTHETVNHEDEEYHADLPDVNYNGADFRVLTVESGKSLYCHFDSPADETDKVLAAINKRNRRIEEEFGVVMKEERVESWMELTNKFNSYVSTSDDAYELNMLIQRDAFALGVKGNIAPLSSLPYCDPEQPWYVHDLNEALSVNGIKIFAYTDECLNMFAQTNCVFYNKRIAEDEGIESPYEAVKNNEWTMEKFYADARKVAIDRTGDSYIDGDDILGAASECDMFYPVLWIGAGYSTIEKDENGTPVYTAYKNESLISFLEEMQEMYNEEGVLFDTKVYQSPDFPGEDGCRAYTVDLFTNGHALYSPGLVGRLAEFTDMIDDYGILPAPLRDEGQTSYHSRVVDGWINVVPITNSHLEMTSVILEALGCESKNYVYDAYYREQLQDRYGKYQDNIEMLDLISKTRTIDLGDTVWQSDVRYKIQDVMWSGDNMFASKLNSIKSVVDFTIELALDDIDSIPQ